MLDIRREYATLSASWQDGTLQTDWRTMMGSTTNIDFGVLDPATTEVCGLENSFHVLLRGKSGGERRWPYCPEVVQRRNGRWAAALNVTLLLNQRGHEALAHAEEFVTVRKGPEVSIGRFVDEFGPHQPEKIPDLFSILLVKMRRPAAPQGVEWNAPGGIMEAGERSAAAAERELHEEVGRVEILARSCLFQHVQFASGVYREWYDIYGVLARGLPKIDTREGAVDSISIPFPAAFEWFTNVQKIPPEDPTCCWVDGKVIMGSLSLWGILA